MTFTTERLPFVSIAKNAAAIAPQSSPLEILKALLVEIDVGQRMVHVTSTNLEVALRQSIPLVSYEGEDSAFSITAKTFADILSLLPSKTVEFSLSDRGMLTVTGDNATYHVMTADRKAYPHMAFPVPENPVQVSGLPAMISRSIFATSNNPEMPMLRCLHLRLTSEGIQSVGSDGTCVATAMGDKQSKGAGSFLIPASSLAKMLRLCDSKDTFTVGMADHQILFHREGFSFSARLMEGSYVDADRIKGSLQNLFSALGDTAELRDALGSVTALSTDGKVSMEFSGSTLTIGCVSAYGEASASVELIPLIGAPSGKYYFDSPRLEKYLRSIVGAVTVGIAQGGMLTLSTEDTFYMQAGTRPTTVVRPLPAKSSSKTAKPKKKAAAKKKAA